MDINQTPLGTGLIGEEQATTGESGVDAACGRKTKINEVSLIDPTDAPAWNL